MAHAYRMEHYRSAKSDDRKWPTLLIGLFELVQVFGSRRPLAVTGARRQMTTTCGVELGFCGLKLSRSLHSRSLKT
jgi:hypothetical protein